MRLRDLFADDAAILGANDATVSGLALDSRAVRPGFLFAALPGTRTDGLGFVTDALARGAAAVLGPPALEAMTLEVPRVIAADPRPALARAAARWFAPQPRVLVAVTGTNGKTSVASFVRQLWLALGRAAASVGTLGVVGPTGTVELGMTTPDALTLHQSLRDLARSGVDHVALEVSSHALEQRRADGLILAAAGFTNLTRDHFDYHRSFEAYRAAKARLFTELLPPDGVAVLNADVPEFEQLASAARERGCAVLDYGRAATALRLLEQRPVGLGQRLVIAIGGRELVVESRLVGAFQAWNLLCALGLVLGSGAELEAVAPHLAKLVGAKGRMELVAALPGRRAIFVDYAHTPDALEQALTSLRAHVAGRLHLLFGCGGDRDPGKRPMMGAIAARLADRIIVTDDNPRSEVPAAIRAAILDACPGAREIGDRAEAIRAAIAALGDGDALLVAGKGHETGQTIGQRTLPFDDAETVRAVVAELEGTFK